MDEQRISDIVKSVVAEVNGKTASNPHPHVCKCNNKLTLAKALDLIGRVERRAAEWGVNAVVAVADAGGRPIAVHCMDDAYYASYDIAVNKAFTSVALKMSTEKLGTLSQPGQPLYGIQFTNDGKLVIFGGGQPLVYHGKIVGGLGVSGGTAEQDGKLSDYGFDVFEEVMNGSK